MALEEYHPYSPSLVIFDDKRDPWVSWANHIKRTKDKSRGGIDCVAKVGTPVYARTAGRMWQLPDNGSAGNSCEFAHDANPGWRDVFSHLSRYASTENGKWFEAGTVIGYTGNTGGVTEHLHWHLLDPKGNRQNPWDYFTPTSSGSSSTAGGSFIELEENDMSERAEAQINELWEALLPGQTGVKTQGGVNKGFGQILDEIKAARRDLATVVQEVTGGEQGKKTAGGLVLANAEIVSLLKGQTAQLGALQSAFNAVEAGGVDGLTSDQVFALAKDGATAALESITVTLATSK